jgi:hypothetical protein
VRQRGRKRPEDFATLQVIEGDLSKARPEAPEQLTQRQAELWESIVKDEPAEFFATEATRQLLMNLCRHLSTSEVLTRLIDNFQEQWLKQRDGGRQFRQYCRTRDEQIKTALLIATKLRITNQSRYTTKTSATASRNTLKGSKPWEL